MAAAISKGGEEAGSSKGGEGADDWQSMAPIRKREPNTAPCPHQILVPTAKMKGLFIIPPDNSEDFDAYEQRYAH
eukprot:4769805-Ditylum_brightwellii.AAC.1